jgi:hypothetical protein
MTGAVAGAYYGVPQEMEARALSYLSTDLRLAYFAFEGLLRRRGIERK